MHAFVAVGVLHRIQEKIFQCHMRLEDVLGIEVFVGEEIEKHGIHVVVGTTKILKTFVMA